MKTALMIAFVLLGQHYNLELAITPTEQATGLMYRKEWTSEVQGMLFINEQPRQVSFWMKNTYLDMIIFYLDKDFNILERHRPKPLDETGILSKTNKVQYILELNPMLEQYTIENWDQFKKMLKKELAKNQLKIDKVKDNYFF